MAIITRWRMPSDILVRILAESARRSRCQRRAGGAPLSATLFPRYGLVKHHVFVFFGSTTGPLSVNRGFSDVIVLLKIIAISLPRTERNVGARELEKIAVSQKISPPYPARAR